MFMSTDRSVRANDSNRSFGVGIYGNSVFRQGTPESEPELTAEQVKAAYEAAVREDKSHQDRLETQKNSDAFVVQHPEFVDNEANGQLLVNQARTMFGNGLITIEMYESAYQYLRENTNFLRLNKVVLAAQEKQAAKQRYTNARAAEAARITNLSEAELEAMPLDEIRHLDAIERQRQMQRIGEEGGW
jgi:hypothetical protein